MSALGIARPRLGGDARRDRSDRLELLARQPAGLVELVHAHVDEDPAAVSSKIGAGGRAVPLKVRHAVEVAQLTCADALAQLPQRRHKASPKADLEWDVRALNQRGRLS